jgi:hypothetical protein
MPHNNKDFVAISIMDSAVSYPPSAKLYCNLCSYKNISFYTNKEKVKRVNKIKTPGPDIDINGNIIGEKTPLVAMVERPYAYILQRNGKTWT